MKELHKRLLTGTILSLLVIITLLFCPPWVFALFAALLLLIILCTEWPLLVSSKERLFWVLTPLYPVLPFILIIIMQLTGYEAINIFLCTVVAAHDTGSYITGKLWGKHKISPTISPSKTWEGFIGGVILACILSLVFFGHNSPQTIFLYIVPAIIIICLSALSGDLFESYLKRRAGVKDSGSLLPGHGGILDRIDGILFAAIIVYIIRQYLEQFLAS